MNANVKKWSITLGWIICGLGALFYCYEYLLRIEPSVMVPELMERFKVTAEGFGLLAALYYYAYTPMQLAVGVLIDKYGTRVILTIAVFSCTLGNFIFSNVHGIYIAGLGRILIGFGSAFAFVGVLKLAAEWLPKHHFALFTGFATGLGMLGAMVGDLELTVLVHHTGWHHTLHIATIIGVILIPCIWLLVRDKPEFKRDHPEQVTISFRDTFAGLWQIVKNPYMWVAGVVGCVMFLSLSVVAELWGNPFFQAVYLMTPNQAAMATSLIFAGWLVGAPFNGWLSDKTKTRRLPIIIGSLLAALCFGVVVYHPTGLTIPSVYLLLFMFGIFSSVQIICFVISRENNPTHIAATAIAFTNLIVMVGGMVFQPLIGKLLEADWDGKIVHGIHAYSAFTYHRVFWVIPIVMLFGTILALVLPETYGRDAWDEFD